MPLTRHFGFSLLELVAVVTLMGILSVVAVARLGPTVVGDVGARSDGRRLALDVIQLRRRAIATGDNHFLTFTTQSSTIVGYQLFRATSRGDVEIDTPRQFPPQLSVVPSSRRWEFNFEGQALAAYHADLTGPNRTRQIDVIPLTGTVQVTGG